ncbi:putative actin binding protein [Aspergillus clavatus NRRL 1]|uniref:Actin binding protein, putative n=1 Tax=Aspergillus clavatus (strain ATCC 1007 / CBS 513.65 / DSM 816 / NCTC 3887 / NRRL 1 / QM 1276 / 107) TaxID=344612 RepID=A1C8D2_ASPCL|nr:actin binding protein, putative [Aspergillus clavatus NRRL 1]EAW13569.1 actin binding protein, putative [Aspergillus clavatus NRRL 1]
MASLNVSLNGLSISKSHQSVINCTLPGSPTYGQWALFSVSTPLVNAFQQGSDNKESILKLQSTGAGELVDLIDEFSEGKIQFAFVKVTDPNSGLPKNVLLAWCGEGVPERTKGYFTSHLSIVSRSLPGYHVQITARSEGDLSPEGIVQKVGDASGAKYVPQRAPLVSPESRPPAAKSAFVPSRAGPNALRDGARPNISSKSGNDDGWGPDAPPVTRTELEKVQSAYKPTKVNIEEIKSQVQTKVHPHHNDQRSANVSDGVVKGGYQPVGKVDIAAIRRQAKEAGELKDDRPEPVKGAYEPVGKVDIVAIRSKAQKQPELPPTGDLDRVSSPTLKHTLGEQSNFANNSTVPPNPERLTSLPKPKVLKKIDSSSTFTGTKAPLPSELGSKPTPAAVQIGSASRTFADQGGKTPAQQWAERKAKAKEQNDVPHIPTMSDKQRTLETQQSGSAEWKSSYTGKTWAPVQTTHTGGSAKSGSAQQDSAEKDETEISPPSESISAIQEHLAHESSTEITKSEDQIVLPDSGRDASFNGAETAHTVSEDGLELQPPQSVPYPPQQPRSPTPPTPAPVREASPIRIAMPVSQEVTSVRENQFSPPPVIPAQSLQHALPKEEKLEGAAIDIGRETAKAAVVEPSRDSTVRAIVQYDYEKAEDNEIDLKEGDYVSDIEMVDKDWWLGSNVHGHRGLFPSNYVELVELGDGNLPNQPTLNIGSDELREDAFKSTADDITTGTSNDKAPVAIALYDYEAAEDNEVSFPEGAEILNIEFPDDDWWFGEYNGKKGLFPANYVQLGK